jgi:hypothetical protein
MVKDEDTGSYAGLHCSDLSDAAHIADKLFHEDR